MTNTVLSLYQGRHLASEGDQVQMDESITIAECTKMKFWKLLHSSYTFSQPYLD